MYTKLNSISGLGPFEDPALQDAINTATGGAQHGPTRVVSMFSYLVQNVLTLVGFFGLIVSFSPSLALAIAISVMPELYLHVRLGRERVDLTVRNSYRERGAVYFARLLSAPQYAKEIRAFGLGDYFLTRYLSTYKELQSAQRVQQRRALRGQLALAVLSSLITTGAFVAVVLQTFAGKVTIGDIALYMAAIGSLQSGLQGIVSVFGEATESALFYRQYNNLLELPEPLATVSHPRNVPPLRLGIELRCVSFRYTAEHPWILRDLNLYIPAGQCMALVGLNGAGKTTLVKLLLRLYEPTHGQILWDGIDIREFGPDDLRSRIGIIFQDYLRYDLSAHDNIGLGNLSNLNNSDLVRECATQVGVHDTISKLPSGYQTVLSRYIVSESSVGKPGVDLSGGEWQKIATARVLMRDTDFLVLDEPTASLDARAEQEIFSHFATLMSGTTSLLITHRFSTTRIAGLVAVLENGSITEYGTHDELLQAGGTYAGLYNLQAASYR
jgi:ATP-binding cassette subfamily B protein